jgi:quercetin dioxygenase-like cupin family protein
MNVPAPRARDLWFLDTRVIIRVSCEDGADRISVQEHHAPFGDCTPLHLHRNEDEVFHVLEGEVLLRVGDDDKRARAGETLLAPKGIPHLRRVESAGGARWLTITAGKDFERFVRAVGRPAERDGLPDPSGPPTPEEANAFAAIGRQHGIEIVGPPLA